MNKHMKAPCLKAGAFFVSFRGKRLPHPSESGRMRQLHLSSLVFGAAGGFPALSQAGTFRSRMRSVR